MKTICVLTVGLCVAWAQSNPLLAAGASKATETHNSGQAKLSWGLDDIVKLSKAGVDETVILTYIKNSGVGYNPTAQDLIQLRELGVSSLVTAALMQRGGEVRQAATVEAQKQAQAAAPAAANAQPAPVYAAPATYVAPASTVTYIGYPRYSYTYGGYCPPTYYSAPYYPRYYGYYGGYYPRVSFGVNFGHVRFSGFHGGSGHYRGGFRHCR